VTGSKSCGCVTGSGLVGVLIFPKVHTKQFFGKSSFDREYFLTSRKVNWTLWVYKEGWWCPHTPALGGKACRPLPMVGLGKGSGRRDG
jgi:hypothetical protein